MAIMNKKVLSSSWLAVLLTLAIGCAGGGGAASIPGDGWSSSGDKTKTVSSGSVAQFKRSIQLTKFDKKKIFDLSITAPNGWKATIAPKKIVLEDGAIETANYVADVTVPAKTPNGKYTATVVLSEKSEGETKIPLEINVAPLATSKITRLSNFTKDVNQNYVSSFKIETGAHDGVNNKILNCDVSFLDALQFKDPKAGGVSMEPFQTAVYTVKLLPLTNSAAKKFAFVTSIEAASGILKVNSTFDVQTDPDMTYSVATSYDNGVGVSPTGSDQTAQYEVTYVVAAGHAGQFTASVSGLDPEYGATVVPPTVTISSAGGSKTFTVTIRCKSSYSGGEKFMLARFRLVHSSEPAMDRYLGLPVRIIP